MIKQTFLRTLVNAKGDLGVVFCIEVHHVLMGSDVHLPVFQQILVSTFGSSTPFISLPPTWSQGHFIPPILTRERVDVAKGHSRVSVFPGFPVRFLRLQESIEALG